MFKNVISKAISLLLLVCFIPGLLLANTPHNHGNNPSPTPCDGKCGGGCKDENTDNEEPEDDDAEYCPKCGAKGITAKFCGECGAAKPEGGDAE